jgi:hypothetical protein
MQRRGVTTDGVLHRFGEQFNVAGHFLGESLIGWSGKVARGRAGDASAYQDCGKADDGGLGHQVAFAGGQRSGGRCSLAARPFAFLGGSGVRECHTSGVGQHPHMAAGDVGFNRPGRDGPGLGNEARQGGIFIRAVKRVENRPNLIVRVVAEFVPLRRVNRRRRSNGYGLGHVSLDGLECPPLQRPDRTDGLAQDNCDLLDGDTSHHAKQENISLIGDKTFESGDDPLLSESIHHDQCWTLRRS